MISLNRQPVEKRTSRADGMLEVVNIWKTIQGEGPFSGVPSVFVRLAGCNLQCPACDTDYTSNRVYRSPYELVTSVVDVGMKGGALPGLVVFTGGEPFRQKFGDAARLLMARNFTVQVETNGTLWQPDMPLVPLKIVCSPKTPVIHSEIIPHIHALKYVVKKGHVDELGFPTSALGGPAPWRPEGIADRRFGKVFRLRDIYIQPEDDQDPILNTENIETAVEICLKHGYQLSLQIHKLVGVE